VIVLDASVALKFFLPEVESDEALRLLASRLVFAAPDIFPLELTAAITKYHRRKLITIDEARAAEAAVSRLAVDLHPWRPLLAPAFELSLLLCHGVYDCLYLALARQLSIPLVTADRRMKQKALSAGFDEPIRLLSDADRLLDEQHPRPGTRDRS
jgi:predicted nucleic acid-binding protein